MPATEQISEVGLPVELDQMESELRKLWDEAGAGKTRASLVNLAVYSEEPDSLSRNTEIISQITQDHACRALLISVNRAAKENRVDAWINAHCHTGSAKSQQICSEQLSFHVEGPCVSLLASIVFSHLDSDLPFYLWWQSEFHEEVDAQLWSWIDRLIYDSHDWSDFQEQLRLLDRAQAELKERVILCDLNWTRLLHLRRALAQFFDHPVSHRHFNNFNRVEIDFAPGYRSTALLFTGWISAQLNWTREEKAKRETLRFQNETGKTIDVVLAEKKGEPIGRCLLHADTREYRLEHPAGTDLLDVSLGKPGQDGMHQLMPALENNPVALMHEELMRGGARRIYLRALECVRDLF